MAVFRFTLEQRQIMEGWAMEHDSLTPAVATMNELADSCGADVKRVRVREWPGGDKIV